MNTVIDDTSPVLVEECVNYQLDDREQNNLIEENETEVHNEGWDKSTENESATSEDVGEKLKRVKKVIPKNIIFMKFMKATKDMITLVVMILFLLKKQKWGQLQIL